MLNDFVQTLRDELRKVQSSAALLERQRNPGVGYWTAKDHNSSVSSRTSVSSESLPRPTSPPPITPSYPKEEEDINLEYIRNVILQFLEHQEMRVSAFLPTAVQRSSNNHFTAQFSQGFIYHPSFHPTRDSKVDIKSTVDI